MCNGCDGRGICRSLTVPAYQVCTVPYDFIDKMGNRPFKNIDLQRYLTKHNMQVHAVMCRDRTDLALARRHFYDMGFIHVAVFTVKVPECYNQWAVKWHEIKG